MTYWAAAYTTPGSERKARDNIEAANRGTFIPTFTKTFVAGGRRKTFERAYLNRYILVAFHEKDDEDGLSAVMNAEGVHKVFCTQTVNDKGQLVSVPCRVSDKDVERLMWSHIMGDGNVTLHRGANGRFAKPVQPRKRRARPRKGKKARSLTYITGANQAVTT